MNKAIIYMHPTISMLNNRGVNVMYDDINETVIEKDTYILITKKHFLNDKAS